ncbi:MAG: hypothetical protein PHN72_00270 [Bacilli bacterium]|nr:hypothetical protein [Bacilli bacterium]
MNKAKVICMCGSLKYTEELMRETENLTLQGYNVISVIYETRDRDSYTKEEIDLFVELHHQKIDLADAIYVINPNGYIGAGTKSDIDYAKALNKEIYYLYPVLEEKMEQEINIKQNLLTKITKNLL